MMKTTSTNAFTRGLSLKKKYLPLSLLLCSSSSEALLLSTKGEIFNPEYALPCSDLPTLPNGQSLRLRTSHDSGILGASLWPAAAPLCSYLKEHSKIISFQNCIELGAGTGAVGLFFAGLGCCPSVTLTDIRPPPESAMYTTDGNSELSEEGSDTLIEILEENVKANRDLWEGNGCEEVSVQELDWTRSDHLERIKAKGLFDLILCSDVTHFSAMHQPLATTIAELLHPTKGVCLLSHQERMVTLNGHDRQLQDFIATAIGTGLDVETINNSDQSRSGRPIAMLKIQQKEGSSNGGGSQLIL